MDYTQQGSAVRHFTAHGLQLHLRGVRPDHGGEGRKPHPDLPQLYQRSEPAAERSVYGNGDAVSYSYDSFWPHHRSDLRRHRQHRVLRLRCQQQPGPANRRHFRPGQPLQLRFPWTGSCGMRSPAICQAATLSSGLHDENNLSSRPRPSTAPPYTSTYAYDKTTG